MNTHKLTFGIATLALLATTASLFVFTGCSGDDSTADSGPTNRDSGVSDSTTGTTDSGKEKKDGTSPNSDAPVETDAGADASDASEDVVSLDTGMCESDSSTCNTCYTDAQAAANPYNACSPFTANCLKFDPTRVPEGGVGQL
jgi:hypothetical protein